MKTGEKIIGFGVLLLILASVGFAGFSDYNEIIGPHYRFHQEFGVEYPKTDAQRFAVKPIINKRLGEMHDKMAIFDEKLDTLQKEIESLPARDANEIAVRSGAFEKLTKLQKEEVRLEHQCHYFVYDAAQAGFEDEGVAAGFPSFWKYGLGSDEGGADVF